MAELSVEQAIQIVLADMTGKGLPAPDRWTTVQACWGIIADSMRPSPEQPERSARRVKRKAHATKQRRVTLRRQRARGGE